MQPSTADGPEPQRLTALWLVSLHLAPGIVFTAVLVLVSRVFVQHGYTAYLAEILLIPVCLVPVLVSIMLVWDARSGESLSLVCAIRYREHGTVGDYIAWPLLLFLCCALGSLVLAPLADLLESSFLSWFPPQLGTDAMLGGLASSPRGLRRATLLVAALLSGVVAPLVEEAYFRGFLLPRMQHLGLMAPALNAFLFGLYHFFSPWALPVIFVIFLPVAYVVQARRNFRIGVVAHAMFNLTGVLTLTLRLP